MIRKLFKDPTSVKPFACDTDTIADEFDFGAPNHLDNHVDTLKRRRNKFKKTSENKNPSERSSSIHSGVAR